MTVNVLRPNGTISAGDATFSGGAGNFHGNTSDDSDTSYAELGTQATLSLGTVTLAAGEVTKQVRVRQRVRSVSSTATSFAGVYKSGDSFETAKVQNTATTTITTYTGSYVPVTWTQSQIDGLTLVAWRLAGSVDVRFVELYVDLVTATVPTLTVDAPTGTVTTSAPTASIAYAPGSDGGPKTHHRLKVFTNAVATGGGFDPETSANIYDSGIVASSSVSIPFGPVVDGTSHRCYVKAAQTINGTPQWSTWANSTFTVDTTGPDVTSITAVPSAGGSITVTVNRNTGGPAWDAVTVERSFDSGSTWEFVRGATVTSASNEFATFAANTFTVVDAEVPNGRSVIYRARGKLTTQVGDWSANSAATSWSSQAIWLKSIDDRDVSRTVTLQVVPDYSLSETQTQTVAIQTETTTAATDLEALLGPPRRVGIFHVLGATHPVTVADGGSTLLLQYPATHGLTDRYLTVTGYSQGFIAGPGQQTVTNISLRLFSVETVTVARPADTASS